MTGGVAMDSAYRRRHHPPLSAAPVEDGEVFTHYVEDNEVFTHCSTKVEPSRIKHHMPIEEPTE